MRLPISFLVILWLVIPASAGEITLDKEKEPEVKVDSESDNDRLRDLVRKILRELEEEKEEKAKTEQPPAAEKEPEKDDKEPLFGFPMKNNRKGFRFYIGGKLEIEHIWHETNEGNVDFITGKESGEWEGIFRIKEFKLIPEARFGSFATLKGELVSKNIGNYRTKGHTHTVDVTTGSVSETTSESDDEFTTSAGIEEFHITFHLPFEHKLKIGLDERWMRPSRKTETYPMLGTAFWWDETMQVLLKGEKLTDWGLYYALGWGTGLTFGSKDIGNRKSPITPGANAGEDRIFHDDDWGDEKKWEYTAGLGFRYGLNPEKDRKRKTEYLDLRVYYFNSRMLDDEIQYLQDHVSGYLGTLQHQHRAGARFEYSRRGFYAETEYVWARDARLDRYGSSFALGYKFQLGPEGKGYKYGKEKTGIFKSVFPLVRFDVLEHSLRGFVLDSASGLPVKYRKNVNDPAMWNRTQLTLAVITELTDNMEMRLEYVIRDENTGGFTSAERNVDNDEMLLFFSFKF
jgi:hypothetical protein